MAANNPIIKARNDGYVAGIQDTRKLVLDYLEVKYMSDQIERGTPLANSILEIATELSELLKRPLPTNDPNVSI